MKPYWLDTADAPEAVWLLCDTPPMMRLRDVGMNCGCEYTSFSRFRGLMPYSRFEHSLGVAALIWRFTGSLRESVAGLLHDVSTPVFAHTVDFLHGDYLTQESTEEPTERMIRESREMMETLRRFSLSVDEVKDYHCYPIADNETPRLSCDRLEYTLGNLVNFGFRSAGEVNAYLADLTTAANETGTAELAFRHHDAARAFGLDALECSRIYISEEDRYAMQRLSEVLQTAIAAGVLTEAELYGTETAVIGRLMEREETKDAWLRYRSLSRMLPAEAAEASPDRRLVPAKRRYIDPLVMGKGRLSQIDPEFAREKEAFLSMRLDRWIAAV